MQLTYEAIPSLPVGAYVGRFLGYRDAPPPQPGQRVPTGRDGNALQPGMIWEWEVTDGPEKGKIADRMTGKQPTPKSACTAIAAAVSGAMFQEGLSIDFTQFVGKLYRFNVEPREMSDGTRVSALGLARAYDLEAAARGGQPTAAANGPPPQAGPPPRPGPAGQQSFQEHRRYWIVRMQNGPPELVTDAELSDFVRAGANPETELCCPEGTRNWVPIAQVRPDLRAVKQIPF